MLISGYEDVGLAGSSLLGGPMCGLNADLKLTVWKPQLIVIFQKLETFGFSNLFLEFAAEEESGPSPMSESMRTSAGQTWQTYVA